ncbi:hypothetical protein ACFV3E_42395 [Streptomyces sp. NPDC059718]
MALATIGVVGADGPNFRWPGPAMLALTASAVLFLASIEIAVRARAFLYNMDDVKTWFGSEEEPRTQDRAWRQRDDFMIWYRLTRWSTLAYRLGLVLLGVGAVGILAPPEHASAAHTACRWAATALWCLALIAYGLWSWWLMRRAPLTDARRYLGATTSD